jgi:hypothetical protein
VAVRKAAVLENVMEFFMISIGVLSRLLPHPANMTAVGALALFGGAKFDAKKAVLATLAVMLISDIVIGFHSLMWATYGSMVLAVLIGRWIGRKGKVRRIIGGTLLSSLVFFIITNFAVWAATPLYAKTMNGLITCYVMAIPFFRNSLVGDCLYSFLFFWGYEYVHGIVTKNKYIFRTIWQA